MPPDERWVFWPLYWPVKHTHTERNIQTENWPMVSVSDPPTDRSRQGDQTKPSFIFALLFFIFPSTFCYDWKWWRQHDSQAKVRHHWGNWLDRSVNTEHWTRTQLRLHELDHHVEGRNNKKRRSERRKNTKKVKPKPTTRPMIDRPSLRDSKQCRAVRRRWRKEQANRGEREREREKSIREQPNNRQERSRGSWRRNIFFCFPSLNERTDQQHKSQVFLPIIVERAVILSFSLSPFCTVRLGNKLNSICC